MSSELWRSRIEALLIHCGRVLVRSSNEGCFLPYVEFKGEIEFCDFEIVKAQLEPEFGISLNVLHYGNYQIDKEQRQIKGIYILEQQVPTEEIPTENWCSLSTLNSLSFINPEQKSIIKAYLTEIESGNTPPLRPPWAQPRLFFSNKESLQLCRDRYLVRWTQYESKERLLDAWKVAKPLCALHHAVTYQHIVNSLEPITKHELNALPYFLQKIIECLSEREV